MSCQLQQVANISSIVTGIGAVLGAVAYIRHRYAFHRKSKALEKYLLKEKLDKKDNGQRTLIRIISTVGLTEDEILQISFSNPKIRRVVKVGEDNLAKTLLFEYDPDGKSK